MVVPDWMSGWKDRPQKTLSGICPSRTLPVNPTGTRRGPFCAVFRRIALIRGFDLREKRVYLDDTSRE
jgi:hypothetical protein